jgi:hypothetical protein
MQGNRSEKEVVKNYRRIPKWEGVNFNVNPRQVYALLENATTGRNRELKDMAKKLLFGMATKPWSIRAGGHTSSDPNLHITINVKIAGKKECGYHLWYVIFNGKMQITKITDPPKSRSTIQ